VHSRDRYICPDAGRKTSTIFEIRNKRAFFTVIPSNNGRMDGVVKVRERLRMCGLRPVARSSHIVMRDARFVAERAACFRVLALQKEPQMIQSLPLAQESAMENHGEILDPDRGIAASAAGTDRRKRQRRFAAGRRTEAEVVERERGRVRRIGRACHDGRTSPPSRA